MSRRIARILKNLIENNEIDISILHYIIKKDKICENLLLYPVKTYNFIKKYIPNIEEQIDNMSTTLYSEYSSFVVFGCPDSTDIDIVVFIDKKYLDKSQPRPLSMSETIRLKTELSSIGYDVSRNIDINLISIEDGRCIGKSKGGEEITNIIVKTYQYHNQLYDLPQLDIIDVKLIDRIRSISKFIITYIKSVVDKINYIHFREEKNRIFMSGTDEIIKYSAFLLDKINLTNHTRDWYDYMKSLTMKIIQLILLVESNDYIYTKKELADCLIRYNYNKDNALYLLYRGKYGLFDISDTIKLFDYYKNIIDKYFTDINCTIITIPKNIIKNTSELDDELFNLFIQSPNEVIEREKWCYTNISDTNINDLFLIESTDIDLIDLDKDIIDKHFIQISQRSNEWKKLIKYYQCGRNSHDNVKPTIDGMYNLLRGAITESIIINMFNPESIGLYGWKKVNVGLLVEEKEKEKSRGCAPDLILTKDGKIIPVEIKTLHSSIHNSDYYNKMDLAIRQLESVENILGKDIIINKLIIIAYWKEELIIECYKKI